MRCLVICRSKLKWHSEVLAHAVRVRLGSWERVGSIPTFCIILGCSQVVRHGTLTPAFDGSNPSTPAIFQRCYSGWLKCGVVKWVTKASALFYCRCGATNKHRIATNQWRLLLSLLWLQLCNENLAKQSSIEKLQLAKQETNRNCPNWVVVQPHDFK